MAKKISFFLIGVTLICGVFLAFQLSGLNPHLENIFLGLILVLVLAELVSLFFLEGIIQKSVHFLALAAVVFIPISIRVFYSIQEDGYLSGLPRRYYTNSEFRDDAEKPAPTFLANNSLTLADFENTSWVVGYTGHLLGCEFEFACDCCKGELFLLENSAFYLVDYCLADRSITSGTFSYDKSKLALNFSGKCVSDTYNWEQEMDSTVTKMFYIDSQSTPHAVTFEVGDCDHNLFLGHSSSEKMDAAAIKSEMSTQDTLHAFQKEGIVDRFEALQPAL